MKKLIILFLLMLKVWQAEAQKTYGTTGGDLIFSTAIGQLGGSDISGPLRFSAFYHANHLFHYDFSPNTGVFLGVGVRNIGFIAEFDSIRNKFRSYALSFPLAIKLGEMDGGTYFFAGVAMDLMFAFKEKRFVNDDRVYRSSQWFSSRTRTFVPNVFIGVKMAYGSTIKLGYYLSNFLNPEYSRVENGQRVRPYANSETNLIYLSLGLTMRNRDGKAKFRVRKA
jgi:hypothetical protein